MKKARWRKGLVIGVGLIFIGIEIIPISGEIVNEDKTLNLGRRIDPYGEIIFDQIIIHLMEKGHFPSLSACIVVNKEVAWAKGYGLYDMENSKQATENTIYMVASISKTITGTALMQLYDEGLIDLDEDVNKYLPFSLRNLNYPDDPITFRMLLSHTSSLAGDSTFSSYWWGNFSGEAPIPWYPYPWLGEYLIPGGKYYSPSIWSKSRPGEQLIYANINFDLIAYLVELISNQSFHEYCYEHIFMPLDMKDTSFRLSDLDIGNVAVPYHYLESGRYRRYEHPRILHYPVAGLRTSISDLSHFLIAHVNDGVYNGVRILTEESIKEMHKIQAFGNNSFNYGLAWTIWKYHDREVFSGHWGDYTPGFSARMMIRLRDDTAIILFVNGDRMLNNWEDGNAALSGIQNILFLKAALFKIFGMKSIISSSVCAYITLLLYLMLFSYT